MPRSPSEPAETYKERLWEYAHLHRSDAERYPWRVPRIRAHLGCSLEELHEHKTLRDLFWNVRRILDI